MKTLLIGANGQLGSDIVPAWANDTLIPLTHADIEVTDRERVHELISRHSPDIVVNTSAFHQVDLCETEGEKAFAVNAMGALHLADACAATGAALMHISTDYVFSGRARRPYTESDPADAVNVYGVSKAAGEQLIRQRLARHYIVRTSGLYGIAGASGKGGNFVERMLQLAGEGRDLKVVDDQTLSPTFTADLAQALLEVARSERFGTYHVTNSDSCSWFEFARTIFELTSAPARLSPTTAEAFGAKAARPEYSVLANDALAAAGIAPLRPWRDALAAYLGAKGRLVSAAARDR
jgi:dTDP-4-dehydrorhamnose reductase